MSLKVLSLMFLIDARSFHHVPLDSVEEHLAATKDSKRHEITKLSTEKLHRIKVMKENLQQLTNLSVKVFQCWVYLTSCFIL